MRLGDLDALCQRVKRSTASKAVKVLAEVLINTAPTIDAVPVVRCRECKYLRQYNDKKETYFCTNPRGIADPIIKRSWFCSNGKKKGDAHE